MPYIGHTHANPHKLGALQLHMYTFCVEHPGPHTLSPDRATVRVAQSLQRRGLVHLTDCGMATATGKPVLLISAVDP